MFKADYKFDFDYLLDYYSGKVNKDTNTKEYMEIRAFAFAMHLLIPTQALLMECGGYDNLRDIYDSEDYSKIKQLANKFEVPEKVMVVKICSIVNDEIKKEKSKKEQKQRRVLKKENGIIYPKFN